MHDTIEDTELTYEDLMKKFWQELANMLIALSKEVDWKKLDKQEYFQNLRRNSQALKVKWYDKLHNTYSLVFKPEPNKNIKKHLYK